MKRLLSDIWNGEPAMVLAIIEAALIFGVALIGGLSKEQALALYGIVRVATAFYTRDTVYSPATVARRTKPAE